MDQLLYSFHDFCNFLQLMILVFFNYFLLNKCLNKNFCYLFLLIFNLGHYFSLFMHKHFNIMVFIQDFLIINVNE